MTDLLIRGGLVVDGTGSPGVRADVAITDGRITDVGDVAGRHATRMIDARDRVVAPGFIDVHSHSDNSVFVNDAFESALHMGVTLVVCGNCGASSAPVSGLAAEELDRSLAVLDARRTWSSFAEYAAPRATGSPAPTIANAPRSPRSTSVKCIEPPTPLQQPVERPINSAKHASIETPRARAWPWPR